MRLFSHETARVADSITLPEMPLTPPHERLEPEKLEKVSKPPKLTNNDVDKFFRGRKAHPHVTTAKHLE
jgi:hypothetical protein